MGSDHRHKSVFWLDVYRLGFNISMGRERCARTLERSQPLKTFAAHRYSDRSAAIHALAALGRLSDDHSWFKLEIIPVSRNTHVEIRIPQFHLRCLIVQEVQAYDHRNRCLWRS